MFVIAMLSLQIIDILVFPVRRLTLAVGSSFLLIDPAWSAPLSLWEADNATASSEAVVLYAAVRASQAHRARSSGIRSVSAKDIYENMAFFGLDQLAAPSSLESGSPEELVLRFVSALEAPNGYDDYFRGVRLPPPLPLSQMTLGDVMAWQVDAGQRRQGYKPASVAVGNYQVITDTMNRVVRKLGLDLTESFDAPMQDRIGLHLLYGRGFGEFLTGAISPEQFANNLAHEWAALPLLSGPDAGKSAYWRDGVNKALVSAPVFRAVLAEALDLHARPQVPDVSKIVRVADAQETDS